jgi:hypothetical protein
MRRTLGLITALLLAAPAVIWTQGSPDRPFRFQGRSWVNQEAFIASGARCATRDLTPERRNKSTVKLPRILSQRGGAAAVTGGVIDVYLHVLTNAAGDGDVRDNQISRQITVPNNAFGPWGWTFNLVSVDRTARRRLVRDGAWHDGGARCESSAPTGNRGRLEQWYSNHRTGGGGGSAAGFQSTTGFCPSRQIQALARMPGRSCPGFDSIAFHPSGANGFPRSRNQRSGPSDPACLTTTRSPVSQSVRISRTVRSRSRLKRVTVPV